MFMAAELLIFQGCIRACTSAEATPKIYLLLLISYKPPRQYYPTGGLYYRLFTTGEARIANANKSLSSPHHSKDLQPGAEQSPMTH